MPASIGVNLRVTGHCSQGGRKYMEDLFSVAYQQTEDERDLEYAFFGIYDGHGGSEAAAFAKEHLMDSIVKQRQFWSDNDEDVLKAIRSGYMITHLNMWKELDKWPKTVTGLPSTAGTTASVAFIRRGKIYIGHVGDSAIVLGYQKDGLDEWQARPLTMDHKPESVIEMERIRQSGGKVVSKAGVPRVVWNRPRPGHKGPMKKSTPIDEIPFLAVARSLGDLWSYNVHNDEFVVSPDPDVGVLTIDPSKFRCLIFGTDGLWNMTSAATSVALVQAAERHNEAAVLAGDCGPRPDWLNPSKSLVDNALQRWSNTRMRADNTSVVTLMLDPPGPPRAAVLRSRNARTQPPPQIDETRENKSPSTPAEQCTPPDPPQHAAQKDQSRHNAPESGLSLVTLYPESAGSSETERGAEGDKSNNTGAPAPLPPCASLDGRFIVNNNCLLGEHCTNLEQEDDEEDDVMHNYGNPTESFFIARLLNKNEVTNTLSDVYDQIISGASSDADINDALTEEILNDFAVIEKYNASLSPATTVVKSVAVNMQATHLERLAIKERVSVCSSSGTFGDLPEADNFEDLKDVTESGVTSRRGQENIQINEISSSSPIDVPAKQRFRKSRGQIKPNFQAQLVHGRSLRSHDAPAEPARPPRAARARLQRLPPKDSKVPIALPVTSKISTGPQDKTILNRTRGIPISTSTPHIKQVQVPKTESLPVKSSSRLVPRIPKITIAEPKIILKNCIVEKPEIRQKSSFPKLPESESQLSNTRITRSKDCQPSSAQGLLKPGKDPNIVTKRSSPLPGSSSQTVINFQSPKSRLDPANSPTRKDQSGNGSEFPKHTEPPFQVLPRRPNMIDNHSECSKENFAGRATGEAAAHGGKRRRSEGARAAAEPLRKRRTRPADARAPHPPDAGAPHRTAYLVLNMASGKRYSKPAGTDEPSPATVKIKSKKLPKHHSEGIGAAEADSSVILEEESAIKGLAKCSETLSATLRQSRLRNYNLEGTLGKDNYGRHSDGLGKSKYGTDKRVLRSSDINCHREVGNTVETQMKLGESASDGSRGVLKVKNSQASSGGRVTRSAGPARRPPAALGLGRRLAARSAWSPALATRNRLRKRLSK